MLTTHLGEALANCYGGLRLQVELAPKRRATMTRSLALLYLKSDQEIDKMRPAGKLAAELLSMIEAHVKPGITTLELNDICHQYTLEKGAISPS